MAYKNPKDRYKLESSKEYDSRPDVKKRRAARNRARYELEKEGLVHKGDGMQVDHINPLSKGGSTARSNLRVLTTHANESFPRTKNHAVAGRNKKK